MGKIAQTVKLKKTIFLGSEEITSLDFVEAKAKHLKGMSMEPGFEDMLNVASKLTNQPIVVIDELSLVDLPEVLGVVGKLLAPFQEIGLELPAT